MFPYPPLHSHNDSLRVLTVLPKSKSSTAGEIECQLETKAFGTKPEYDALSYTWGTEPVSKQIKLNGQAFPVRENLYDALWNLRSSKPRNLWVDAICINQANITERNDQVMLMAFIYTRARRVQVWLGNWAEPVQNGYLSDSNWYALSHNPYWSRLWIIQELVLAEEVRFNLGRYTCGWDKLSSTMNPEWRALEGKSTAIQEMREERYTSTQRLENLIEVFEKAQCSEKRDKIYGFLGMVYDGAERVIKVDYSIPLDRLYAELVRFHQLASAPHDSRWGEDNDRAVKLMHFSHLVQRVFSGAVAESAEADPDPNWPQTIYTARGFVTSEILCLGPSLAEIASSVKIDKSWKLSFSKTYKQVPELRTARKNYEKLSQAMLRWNKQELDIIRLLRSQSAYGYQSDAGKDFVAPNSPGAADSETTTSPLLFLGTNATVGLIPEGTQVGDLICTFHRCKTTVVLRKMPDIDRFKIVGQAQIYRNTGVTEDDEESVIGGYDLSRLSLGDEQMEEDEKGETSSSGSVIILRLDLATLQRLTISF